MDLQKTTRFYLSQSKHSKGKFSMDYTKPAAAMIAVMIVGFLLVVYNRVVPDDDKGYGRMVTVGQIKSYAREICSKALQGKVGGVLYAPAEAIGANDSSVELSWNPTAQMPHAVSCHYELGKGVTELKIDGLDVIPGTVDLSGDAASRAPGSLAEKHWGH
jgi:hypothetical protein